MKRTAGPTAQPSREFQRHHDVEPPQIDRRNFRQAWRITTRLDALLRDGKLTPEHWQAATEYRTAWERIIRANNAIPLAMRIPGNSAANARDERLAAIADTVSRIREAETAIGSLRAHLCFACLVDDAPWVATAKILHIDRETARDWTVAAIIALERAWRGATGRKRVRPLPTSGQHTHRPVARS